MLKEADLVRPLKGQTVQCRVCNHYCVLESGAWGKCGVRFNRDGTLYLAVYSRAVAVHVDPIEKKPLFHFLPGGRALSIGTFGCNLHCQWCQNWSISQICVDEMDERRLGQNLPPAAIVEAAVNEGIEAIAYTYNEPTVFFEYTYDTAVLAHKQGIKNIYVSNGFMSPEALERIAPYLDGINVDLKGFTEALYQEYAGGRLEPIKHNITTIAQDSDIWLEVTTLIIPTLNDSDKELKAIAAWLASVSVDIPWHVSAFHPDYQMRDRPRTPSSTLERAYEIGKQAGLNFIYVGNVLDPTRESTYCPNCRQLLIKRMGFGANVYWETAGVCPNCGTHIPGVWL